MTPESRGVLLGVDEGVAGLAGEGEGNEGRRREESDVEVESKRTRPKRE